MTRGRRIALGALGAALVVVLALVVAWPHVLTGAVKWEASRRGVELTVSSAEGGFGHVELRDVRATLRSARVVVTAPSARVFLSWLSPRRVDVTGAVVALDEADLSALLAYEGGDGLTWYVRSGEVRLGATRLAPIDADVTPSGGRVVAGAVQTAAGSLGKTTLSWTRAGDTSSFVVEGLAQGTTRREGAGTRLDVTLVPLALARVSPGLPPAARLSGTVGLLLGRAGGITGETSLVLDAFTPSVAREAAPFVGSRTQLSSKLLSQGGGPIELRELKVQNGSLALAGAGTVSRQGDVRAALDGAVPCARVAGQAAKAAFGDLIGGIAGVAAGNLVSGTIGLHLDVSASLRQPSASRIVPSVRVGCTL